MPLIELTLPEGALPVATQDELMKKLTNTLLEAEGAPVDSAAAQAISWGYVDERPVGRNYQAGLPDEGASPRYKVNVTVPAGVLTDEKKLSLVEGITRDILAAEGSEDDPAASFRVWVLINEVTDGNWGGAGRIWRLRDIAKLAYAGADDVDAGVAAVVDPDRARTPA